MFPKYVCDETILHNNLKEFFAGADKQLDDLLSLTEEIKPGEDDKMPTTYGRIVTVFQRSLDGAGYIRVRWGTRGEAGTILAEYHFDAQKIF